jgi:Mg2+-importing ATPase
VLATTSLVVAALGALLPFTPLGAYFGFVPLPVRFYLILATMVVIYLMMVELAKQGFYRWHRAYASPATAANSSPGARPR